MSNPTIQKFVLEFQNVSKIFNSEVPVVALQNIDLKLPELCFAALVGSSGSGKSTFLNIASGLESPSTGSVKVGGHELSKMDEYSLSLFRRNHLGFVFQSYNLLPTLTAVENVEFTLLIRGEDPRKARTKALECLRDVQLEEKSYSFPNKLSGGQQQRVAVARALWSEPKIIFADEPTANLDSITARNLIDLFEKLNRDRSVSFLFSTHDHDLISSVRTVVPMKNGQIVVSK